MLWVRLGRRYGRVGVGLNGTPEFGRARVIGPCVGEEIGCACARHVAWRMLGCFWVGKVPCDDPNRSRRARYS